MTEIVSLLNELKAPGYEGAILTTFNLHIPFLEEVVVRRLQASGCRHIIVLADENQLVRAIEADPPKSAGRDYLLLPISSQAAFHPKILMMVGKSKGFLAIGSHNLTYSGYGHNREVTNAVRHDSKSRIQSAGLFQAVWEALARWIRGAKIYGEVGELVGRTPLLAPWIRSVDATRNDDARLLIADPDSPTLFDQLIDFVNTPIDRLFITGPFFDSKLAFLTSLVKQLKPNIMIVAIDPSTAQIPDSAKRFEGARFVTADSVGLSKAAYLHAKIVHIIAIDGRHFLLSGSANPSARAWLERGHSANFEAMVALRGEEAELAAERLNLSLVEKSLELEPEDWGAIADTWADRANDKKDPTARTQIVSAAVSDDGFVEFPYSGDLKAINVSLFCKDEKVADSAGVFGSKTSGVVRIELPPDEIISLARVYKNGEIAHIVVPHYPKLLEEKARTGAQRKFRSALGSLDTDTPDLTGLFKCIEKAIYEDQESAPSPKRGPEDNKAAETQIAPASLEVSIKARTTRAQKKRISAGSDLGYILDILIRSLGRDTPSEYENVDTFGRNEEEQVGKDDEVSADAARTEAAATDILKLCHSKVSRLVNRAKKQMEAFIAGDVSDRIIVTRLVAVFALLSQLRAQDKHIWWVNTARGESTVPNKVLKTLMSATCKTLLAHPLFLYDPEAEEKDVPDSEEYVTLRGLLFWLGAVSGSQLQLSPPFNEKIADRTARIQQNQDFLSLSDLVAGDEEAAATAEATIAITNIELHGFLTKAINFRRKLSELTEQVVLDNEIMPGDFAYFPKRLDLGIRAVLHADSHSIELAGPGGIAPKRYQQGFALGIPFRFLE